MWRAAKRAAEAAVRSAGRAPTASSSHQALAPETRASAIARVARDVGNSSAAKNPSGGATKGKGPGPSPGCSVSTKQISRPKVHDRCVDRGSKSKSALVTGDQRRRSVHAEGFVRVRYLWEMEAAARRAVTRGGELSPATAAMTSIAALRRAGCSLIDVARHGAFQKEAFRLFSATASATARQTAERARDAFVSPMESSLKTIGTSLRRVVPTLALRHAGGSWSDVVSHPAFKFLGKERDEVLRAVFVGGSGPIARSAGTRVSAAAAAKAKRERLPGPRFPEITEELAYFISSSQALRHAGCSWIDVARHGAFHACIRARVVAGGYSVYLATFVRHPFTTALATSVVKCVASDVLVQKVIERKEELDAKRTFCFFVLGLTYVGAFQYGLYNHLIKPAGDALTRISGSTGASVGLMVAIDQLLVCPLLYLPAFFGLKSWASGECDAAQVPARMAVRSRETLLVGANAMKNVSATGHVSGARPEKSASMVSAIVPTGSRIDAPTETPLEDDSGWFTLLALWAYWVPAQAVNFWVVPRHLTIPFMNVAGFGWNGIMSAMNGSALSSSDGFEDVDGGASEEASTRVFSEETDLAAPG